MCTKNGPLRGGTEGCYSWDYEWDIELSVASDLSWIFARLPIRLQCIWNERCEMLWFRAIPSMSSNLADKINFLQT